MKTIRMFSRHCPDVVLIYFIDLCVWLVLSASDRCALDQPCICVYPLYNTGSSNVLYTPFILTTGSSNVISTHWMFLL